jgi:cytochrome c-type biogenesis protein CcmH/NrfG
MPLGLKPGENLVNNRKIDPIPYTNYLRARALLEGREGAEAISKAALLLQEVIASNPDYAPAWADLAHAHYYIGLGEAGRGPISEARARADDLREKGESAARRALQLDPSYAGAYEELAQFASTRGRMLEADEIISKAVMLDPVNPAVLQFYANRQGTVGNIKEGLKLLETAHAVDAFSPGPAVPLVEERWLNGQDNDAIALAKTLAPQLRAPLLAMIYASQGKFAEAAEALNELKDDALAVQAAELLRSAPAKTAAPDKLPRFGGAFEWVYLYTSAPDRALDNYQRRADANYFGSPTSARVWHPSYAPLRKTTRFKELMKKAGVVEYWRVKGWPPQCHPTTGDDFSCE